MACCSLSSIHTVMYLLCVLFCPFRRGRVPPREPERQRRDQDPALYVADACLQLHSLVLLSSTLLPCWISSSRSVVCRLRANEPGVFRQRHQAALLAQLPRVRPASAFCVRCFVDEVSFACDGLS